MALLSLDRHDVLETIRQSNGLHEAFLRVAKLPAVGEYKTLTNADRIRSMTDEELAEWITELTDYAVYPHTRKDAPCISIGQTCAASWLEWLKREADCDNH